MKLTWKGVRRGSLLLVVAVAAWFWFVWPPPVWYRWAWPRETSFMAIRRRSERPQQPRLTRQYDPQSIRGFPAILKTAVMVGEDDRFYQHSGIDYIELRHAMGYRPDSFSWSSSQDRAKLWAAIRSLWSKRGKMRGASTITQQLAKNLYLSESRNPLRKLKEALTAWRLEYWLGKERILELYLNVVELGPELWGVEAASRKYFHHGAARLSLDEAAALAATLPFPLSSNPDYRPGRMRWRQQMIIRRLRGEDVVIPKVVDTVPDSLRVKPDTVIDTVRVRIDTISGTRGWGLGTRGKT